MEQGTELVMALHRKVLAEEAAVERLQAEERKCRLWYEEIRKNPVPVVEPLDEPPAPLLLGIARLADTARDTSGALRQRVNAVVARIKERIAELEKEKTKRQGELVRAREAVQRENAREEERAERAAREGDALLEQTEQTLKAVEEKKAHLAELKVKLAAAKEQRERDFHRMLCVAVDAPTVDLAAPRPERRCTKPLLFPHPKDKK